MWKLGVQRHPLKGINTYKLRDKFLYLKTGQENLLENTYDMKEEIRGTKAPLNAYKYIQIRDKFMYLKTGQEDLLESAYYMKEK